MINELLNNIKKVHTECINEASLIKTIESFKELRNKYMSKNGVLQNISEDFKKLSTEDKKQAGSFLQELKKNCNDIINSLEEKINNASVAHKNNEEGFYPCIQKNTPEFGKLHIYTQTIEDIRTYFTTIGFDIVDGPIIEEEEYNFTALNIPKGHPARSDSDTFWINDELALRTQTSSIQIREARKRKAPFAIIAPGKVFRNEATDASHDYMFYQLEGLYLHKEASITTLLYTLREFLRFFFNNEVLEIRTRPFHFPFVEPGLEIDLQCPFCNDGCSTCKKSKWIEIAGAGMVHPNVIKHMHQEADVRGWAFGFGVTRLAMLKYRIHDIRLLHNA